MKNLEGFFGPSKKLLEVLSFGSFKKKA